MRNKDVAIAWSVNDEASTKNMYTDGQYLYSYKMLIGRTLPDGTKQALDVSGKNGYSATTSKHVGLARRYADSVVIPVITHDRNSWYSWREFPYTLEKVRYDDIQAIALEHNTEGLSEVVGGLYDEQSEKVYAELSKELGITPVAFYFETWHGEYNPLYVKLANHQVYKVVRK